MQKINIETEETSNDIVLKELNDEARKLNAIHEPRVNCRRTSERYSIERDKNNYKVKDNYLGIVIAETLTIEQAKTAQMILQRLH